MAEYTGVQEQIEYGLDTIDENRTIEVNLKDLMYIHQTFGELIRFFHHESHFPTINVVRKFLGDSSVGMYKAMADCYYTKFTGMLPADIVEGFDNDRFEHPKVPYYYESDDTLDHPQ